MNRLEFQTSAFLIGLHGAGERAAKNAVGMASKEAQKGHVEWGAAFEKALDVAIDVEVSLALKVANAAADMCEWEE